MKAQKMKWEPLAFIEACDLGVYRMERTGRPPFRVLAYTRKSAEEIGRRMMGGLKPYDGPMEIFLDEDYM